MSDIDVDMNALTAPEQVAPDLGDAVADLSSAPKSAGGTDQMAGQALLIKETDRDLTEHAVALADPDKAGTLAATVAQRQAAVQAEAQRVLSVTLETDPDQFPAQVEKEQERQQAEQSGIAQERAVVDAVSIAAPIDVDQKTKDQTAFRLAGMNDIASLVAKHGLWDKIADFSGFFVPFNLTADISDLVEQEYGFTDATSVEGFILDFQALPAERKKEYWPAIVDGVLAATGTNILGAEVSDDNVLKAAGILMNLLNPEGAATQGMEENLDILFGIGDVVGTKLVTGVLGSAARAIKSQTSAVKVAADLGDAGRAADLNIMAMSNGAAQKTTGVAAQEAATNALPLAQMGYRPEFVEGLAMETSKKLNDFQRQAEGLTRSFRDESALIKEGLLRKGEKEFVIKDRLSEMQRMGTERDVLNEGVHIDNIRVAHQDETGYVISYDMYKEGQRQVSRQVGRAQDRAIAKLEERIARGRDANIPALEAQLAELRATRSEKVLTEEAVTREFRWQLNEATGDFLETVNHALPGFEYGVSNAAWAYTGPGGDFLASFKSASNMADLAAATQSKMVALVNDSNKAVSGVLGFKARGRIADVEIAGDEWLDAATGVRGRTFTPDELMAGVQTQNGTVKLTSPAELEVYYKHRIVADQFWQLENHAARRKMEILGFNNVVRVGTEKVIARELADAGAAKASTRNAAPGSYMWDSRTNEAIEITDDVIDAAYDEGNMLVRLADDTQVDHLDGSTEHLDFAIISRTDMEPLPLQVLNYKQGYVPKINKGVEFIVRENVPAIKRGINGFTTKKTLRFFASKKDAEAFRASQSSKYMRDNPNATLAEAEARFDVRADHEISPMERLHSDAGSSGGLYTGARSSSDLHTGLSGVRTERLSPFLAFQRNAQHIGSLVARNEWRLGEEQRWLNTVDSLGIENKGFRGTLLNLDTKEGRALDIMRKNILRWNQVPTQDETLFTGVMQNLHDWTLNGARKFPGLADKESVKSLLWLKHSNPAAAMKAVAFNLALGVMNPAQLFVQASAYTVALARFPKIAARAGGYAFKLSFTDGVGNPNALKRIAGTMDDVDTPLFNQVREAWERSGLKESVRQNADLNAADSYGVMTLDAVKRMSDFNLVLYRQGELFNRRFSFTASFLEWKRLHPGAPVDNDALKAIKSDANLSMLELNHANRAWWQGGPDTGALSNILGVMTQFQQVGAKAVELIVKSEKRGGFTAREKMRIMLAQTVFYGAAGVPLVNAITSSALEHYGVNMDKDAREVLNQGVAGAIVVNTFGSEVEIAPRLAPFGQTAAFIGDLLFDDTPFAEKAFGVFGDMYGRAGTAIDRLGPMITSGIKGQEMSKEDLLMGLTAIGEIPSSSRNMVKSWIMHNQHKILDRHGGLSIQKDFNWQTEIGQALGFKTIEESEFRITQMSNKDTDDLVKENADAVTWLWHQYISNAETDPLAGRKLHDAMQVIFESLDNAGLEQEVRESVARKIKGGKSAQERELKKFFERTLPEEIDNGAKALRQGFFANTAQERAIVQPLDRGE